MNVKELMALLAKWPPDTRVLVRLDGSIFATDDHQAHADYNSVNESDEPEFFILANEGI